MAKDVLIPWEDEDDTLVKAWDSHRWWAVRQSVSTVLIVVYALCYWSVQSADPISQEPNDYIPVTASPSPSPTPSVVDQYPSLPPIASQLATQTPTAVPLPSVTARRRHPSPRATPRHTPTPTRRRAQ